MRLLEDILVMIFMFMLFATYMYVEAWLKNRRDNKGIKAANDAVTINQNINNLVEKIAKAEKTLEECVNAIRTLHNAVMHLNGQTTIQGQKLKDLESYLMLNIPSQH